MPDLLTTWDKLKQQANTADGDALERLARAYASGFKNVDPQIQALVEEMTLLQDAGKLTAAGLKSTAVYKNLMSTIAHELTDFTDYLKTEIKMAATASAQMGLVASRTLMLEAIAKSLGVAVKDLPKDILNKNSEYFMRYIDDYLRPDGPLFTKIKAISKYYAETIAHDMIQGVGLGWNARKTAEWITNAYGMPLTDSLRMMRTTQNYSYRQGNNATQIANADVLQGVIWCADIGDDRTCMACIALHGQVFPVGTLCNDHHNGRCAMLPWVKGQPNPIEQSGEEWFNEQPESVQKKVMGPEKWDAWNSGKFEFNKLTREQDNDIYGPMRNITPLKDLVEIEE